MMIPVLTMEDEHVHTIMHAAQQQGSIHKIHTIPAHISSYDPRTHMVRCVIPSFIDMTNGDMRVSGWIKLLTPMAGNGWGVQYAPFGGASTENLGAGEQVFLTIVETSIAAYVVCGMSWNTSSSVVMPKLQAGEMILKDAKGNTVYFKADGSLNIDGASTVTISGAANVNITATSNVNITGDSAVSVISNTTVNVTAPAVNIGASGQPLSALITSAFTSLFNGHTHPTPSGGSGAPNQPMGSGQLTTTLKGG